MTQRFSFETEIIVTVAGVERAFDATVTGTYHPADKTPVNSATIDPPEGEFFEFDPIQPTGALDAGHRRGEAVTFGLPPALMGDDEIRGALEDEARAAMEPDPDRERD
jgi:hypothetical protein